MKTNTASPNLENPQAPQNRDLNLMRFTDLFDEHLFEKLFHRFPGVDIRDIVELDLAVLVLKVNTRV